MATAGEGSENSAARDTVMADRIADEVKLWVDNAIGEAIHLKQTASEAADAALSAAGSGISQIISASSDRLHEAQHLMKLVKKEYTAYEDFAVEKIKEGVLTAASHPNLSFSVAAGMGLVVLRRPRSFLIRNTRRLFMSEESMLADAESKVNKLRQSINLMKNETRKLEERALKAEEEMERGRKALKEEGRQIQGELRFARKIEGETNGIKDLINELPRREASKYRPMISALVSQVKQEKRALNRTVSRIVNNGITI